MATRPAGPAHRSAPMNRSVGGRVLRGRVGGAGRADRPLVDDVGPPPGTHPDERDQQADVTDDHEDHAGGVDVETVRGVDLHREGQDRTERDQDQASTNSHDVLLHSTLRRFRRRVSDTLEILATYPEFTLE